MSSRLSSLQALIKSTLEADSNFATITVLTEDMADLEMKILTALGTANNKGGKTGACVIILQPEADVVGENTAGPECKVRVRVQVLEDLLANRDENLGTGLPAYEIAEIIARLLHATIPAGAHAHRKLRVKSLRPIAVPDQLPNTIGHEVIVEQLRSLAAA
jgi:hypothetical protein